MFIGKRPSGEERGQLVKRDRLVWVGTPSTKLDLTRPLPELGLIDLVLLTNPRTRRRPAVSALIATVLASGSKSLSAGGA